jgi:hypothetical protein
MSLKYALRLALVVAAVPALYAADVPVRQITWNFDNLSKIGGLPVTVEGHPKVIDSPVGKAIEFNGVDESVRIDEHPLAGAETFTFEAIFRPDGGAEAQRWFHLAERDPKSGQLANVDPKNPTQDTNARFLFELRVVDGKDWYLDAFVNGPGYSKAIMVREKLHPIGQWYHVADVYDGKMLRSYVNGELQGEAEVAFKPQGPGAASIGVRMNKVNYFHGAVAKARFTNKALTPAEFMKLPSKK